MKKIKATRSLWEDNIYHVVPKDLEPYLDTLIERCDDKDIRSHKGCLYGK